MPRIDFYVLSTKRPHGRELFACRLIEKAYKLGHQMYIHTENEAQARLMDDLLWTFRENSFIPHEKLGQVNQDTPVYIGHKTAPTQLNDILINMTREVPNELTQFSRTIELVDNDPEIRQQGRQRFRTYRDQGFQVTTHQVNR